MSTDITNARAQLEAIVIDVTENPAQRPRITRLEAAAIHAVLQELHRLHIAVSVQQKALQGIAEREKRTAASKPPTPTKSKPKGAHHQ